MKRIPLSQGKCALVDDTDFKNLKNWKWYLANTGYAVRKVNQACILMHRQITNAPKGLQVDHINQNKLDNRKVNLRLCTIQENRFNSKLYSTNSSGVAGVSKVGQKWRARINLNGKEIHLGYHATIEAALSARSKAAIRLHTFSTPQLDILQS